MKERGRDLRQRKRHKDLMQSEMKSGKTGQELVILKKYLIIAQ